MKSPVQVRIPRDMLAMILEGAKAAHPKETILLLRGKMKKNMVVISEIVIPPLSTHGRGFSAFPMHMLPMDFSIVGTVHSHPSGGLMPSIHDLNHALGRVILIAAYPYQGRESVAAYNRDGDGLPLQAV